MNPIQTQSQSSFIFHQKPSLMEINLLNKNNSSHMYDDEGETLKQILRNNDNYFSSGMNSDFPRYPFNVFSSINTNNLIDNNNNNYIKKKDNNKRKKKNNIINSNKNNNN